MSIKYIIDCIEFAAEKQQRGYSKEQVIEWLELKKDLSRTATQEIIDHVFKGKTEPKEEDELLNWIKDNLTIRGDSNG